MSDRATGQNVVLGRHYQGSQGEVAGLVLRDPDGRLFLDMRQALDSGRDVMVRRIPNDPNKPPERNPSLGEITRENKYPSSDIFWELPDRKLKIVVGLNHITAIYLDINCPECGGTGLVHSHNPHCYECWRSCGKLSRTIPNFNDQEMRRLYERAQNS